MPVGKRGADVPFAPPDWVWQLGTSTYNPTHEWDQLLQGYKDWHIRGAHFPAGKGQSPDYKNWGVTLPSIAMSLKRYDQANDGGVIARDAEEYWGGIILAGAAAICRMRAERYIAEAESAIVFELPSKNIIRKALRYAAKCNITKCPLFYYTKLPNIPVVSAAIINQIKETSQ